jgi:carbon-monoxide dehydrogenase medium subunit
MYSFDYARPSSVADAAAALSADPEAKLLAGGQTLIPTLKQRLAAPTKVVDLGGIGELKGIRRDGNTLVIGALTTHADVARSAEVRSAIPALCVLANDIGDAQVRHMGTIGGSIANNDPAADYPAGLLGLGATVATNRREIAADDFFTGLFTTDLGADEIIKEVRFPIPERAGYAKFEQRASRYALVGVCVAKTSGGVRVAVTGSGADGVFRHTAAEQALASNFSVGALNGVTVAADRLMSDMHGSADYRAALVAVMTERALQAALAATI